MVHVHMSEMAYNAEEPVANLRACISYMYVQATYDSEIHMYIQALTVETFPGGTRYEYTCTWG